MKKQPMSKGDKLAKEYHDKPEKLWAEVIDYHFTQKYNKWRDALLKEYGVMWRKIDASN